MANDVVIDVASDLRITLGALIRRLRLHRSPDDPTVPETAVLARLDREGTATSADLARQEQISPQSMGATIATLLDRGLITRAPDPNDGRRAVLCLNDIGRAALCDRRDHRTRALATAMAEVLTEDEVSAIGAALPLLARLADAL
ncbi:MarR family transcriptional regulator [Gordonia sp. VNQ95]|jgi:DNA-binding MarR family transcriptional regulator|uniref:MarR family winged helix-turn-helix transcriptional regulator n=1 Tax=Gordonia TaxID=2053 RepID=UPI0032B42D6A